MGGSKPGRLVPRGGVQLRDLRPRLAVVVRDRHAADGRRREPRVCETVCGAQDGGGGGRSEQEHVLNIVVKMKMVVPSHHLYPLNLGFHILPSTLV